MNLEYIEKVCQAYNYDDDLKRAIYLAIPLLMSTYGEENIMDILKIFSDVIIFSETDITGERLEEIKNQMIGGVNRDLKFDNSSFYGDDFVPDSVYSTQPVYDENLNVIDEVKWIVVKNEKGSYKENGYRSLFDTSINFPYFLHELNHAYCMQKSQFDKEGDFIFEKMGMVEILNIYDKYENKIEKVSSTGIVLEEALTEISTQEQLCLLFEENNYENIREKLESIGHVFSCYSSSMLLIGEMFRDTIGDENLLKYRRDNDGSIIEKFNKYAKKSKISKKYFPDVSPYSYMSGKSMELYKISSESYKYSLEEYSDKVKSTLFESLSPIYAFKDSYDHTFGLKEYESKKDEFSQEESPKKY